MMSTSIKDTKNAKNAKAKAILIIGILFFLFGFVTWVNSVLIPYLKLTCQLSNLEAYLVAFAFYISYLVMAAPSGILLKKIGYKKGISFGLMIMSIGALTFIPAALTRTFGIFLIGLFLQGTGLTLLQTAVNPYITILGPIETAAKRMSIMGICNKVSGAIAPIILGTIALRNTDVIKRQLTILNPLQKIDLLNNLAKRVIMPYTVVAIILVLMAVIIGFSSLPDIEAGENDNAQEVKQVKRSIFHFPHLLLGVLTLFFYVGAEVIAGDSIINYGASLGIPLATAKFFTTFTLLSMVSGYIIGILLIPRYLSQKIALTVSAVLGLILTAVAITTHGYISITSIALLGLANALIWPAIWPLAITGLGEFTKTGASLLVMAIAGGALLPLLYGFLADEWNPTNAYCVLIPCYFCILYYAMTGHKVKSMSNKTFD